ncbi:hypothetical protein [Desulfohalobium retbaense]|uniref:Uncharacterized protein n=1 Tax=Desulfohalobium retbaense (strain ATCC 49708 / DSM 5692 / JCM 16813 / HR100) TaxID=485915 RepID=C8X5V0_DESRD|nr:hypothetical protein [Desulfohalobium retbaense]ACV69797.1 hypothetical protein Dret_2517 [Desulfohalobium retbaense DSM 5692]
MGILNSFFRFFKNENTIYKNEIKSFIDSNIEDTGIDINDENLSAKDIAYICENIINSVSFTSALHSTKKHPTSKFYEKNSKDNLALFYSYFLELYYIISIQVFGIFDSEKLEKASQILIEKKLEREEQELQALKDDKTIKKIGIPEEVIQKTEKEIGDSLYKYKGYHIKYAKKEERKTPMFKCATTITKELYPKYSKKIEDDIYSISYLCFTYLLEYLHPLCHKCR